MILLKIISNTTVINIEKPREWDQHRDHTFYSGIILSFMLASFILRPQFGSGKDIIEVLQIVLY